VDLRRKLCQEKTFPKRSRWMYGEKLCDLLGEYRAALSRANKPRVELGGVTVQELRERRYIQQQIALGELDALDVLLNEAVEVLEMDPDSLENIFGLINRNYALLGAWITSELKRYGPPAGG